jgi:hypothetical protein
MTASVSMISAHLFRRRSPASVEESPPRLILLAEGCRVLREIGFPLSVSNHNVRRGAGLVVITGRRPVAGSRLETQVGKEIVRDHWAAARASSPARTETSSVGMTPKISAIGLLACAG